MSKSEKVSGKRMHKDVVSIPEESEGPPLKKSKLADAHPKPKKVRNMKRIVFIDSHSESRMVPNGHPEIHAEYKIGCLDQFEGIFQKFCDEFKLDRKSVLFTGGSSIIEGSDNPLETYVMNKHYLYAHDIKHLKPHHSNCREAILAPLEQNIQKTSPTIQDE